MIPMLSMLCASDGISGREEVVRRKIIECIEHEIIYKDYHDATRSSRKVQEANFAKDKCKWHVDAMGNLIVFKKGKKTPKNKVLLTAHMDEVGFMITNITQDGYLKFDCVGGIDPAVVCGKAVRVGSQKIKGVIGVNHVHLVPSSEHGKVPKISQMYIDIGAKSKQDASEYVQVGDAAYFDTVLDCFGDNKLIGKALDDRFGCYLMIKMILSELEYDLHFAFLVQEEVGLRGAAAACHQVNPAYAIVLETTTASDIAFVSQENQVCTLGGGAVISYMDRATVYNFELYKKAMKLAKENDIKAQTKTTIAGGNDAGAIHKSQGGIHTLTVSLPCRYLHSGSTVADKSDMISCEQMAKILAQDFANA